ncbi:MAG: hypothetical protein ABI837_13625 [Acidobacteriota bacterium]
MKRPAAIDILAARIEGAAIGHLVRASLELDVAHAAIGAVGVDLEDARPRFYLALGRRTQAYLALDAVRDQIRTLRQEEYLRSEIVAAR